MHNHYAKFRARKHSHDKVPFWGLIGIALCGVAVGAIMFAGINRRDTLSEWRENLESGAPAAQWPEWDSRWSPLPLRRKVPEQVVTAVSGAAAFAALNAEVMRYIPCHCGACPVSHHSNLNCYVREFRQDGTPIWTDHAWTCPICVNVTREVMLMVAQGESVSMIRETIDREYGQAGQHPTTTEQPPQPR